MSTATLDDVISPECDRGKHGQCKSEACACICHASGDEDEDPEDDDY
jgi:hypothetical protein